MNTPTRWKTAGMVIAGLFLLAFIPDSVVAAKEPICLSCHDTAAVPPQYRHIPGEWRTSWHASHGVACNDCHGGDPNNASLAMSPEHGFKGVPTYAKVPEFCGTCHVGVLKNYLDSKHGRALKKDGRGPNCVTCHGAHNVQKASIDLVNKNSCTRCHGYERAETIRMALSSGEEQLDLLRQELEILSNQGVYTGKLNKQFFAAEAAFRIVFHTVDVAAVKTATEEVRKNAQTLEKTFARIEEDLTFRRWFSGGLAVVFLCLAVVLRTLSRTPES